MLKRSQMQGANTAGKGRGARGTTARAAMIARTLRRLEQLREEALAIEAEFAPAHAICCIIWQFAATISAICSVI